MKESVGVPVVANGDIRSEEDVLRVAAETGVDGQFYATILLYIHYQAPQRLVMLSSSHCGYLQVHALIKFHIKHTLSTLY